MVKYEQLFLKTCKGWSVEKHHVSVHMYAIYFTMSYILTLFVKAFLRLTFVKEEAKFTPGFAFVIFSEWTLYCFETYIILYNHILGYWKYF